MSTPTAEQIADKIVEACDSEPPPEEGLLRRVIIRVLNAQAEAAEPTHETPLTEEMEDEWYEIYAASIEKDKERFESPAYKKANVKYKRTAPVVYMRALYQAFCTAYQAGVAPLEPSDDFVAPMPLGEGEYALARGLAYLLFKSSAYKEHSYQPGTAMKVIQPYLAQTVNEAIERACKAMCPACELDGPPIPSSVSDEWIHPATSVGRMKCKAAPILKAMTENPTIDPPAVEESQ